MSVSLNLPLNDVLQTVERPVVFDVIRQLMDLTQISSTTQIRFYGEDAKAAQFNSTLTKDALSNNLWPHRENITIEVDEDHDPDNMLSMAVKYPEQRYIFDERPLNITLRPGYSTTVVNIRILYKAVDKNTAYKWRNEMRSRTAMMRDMFMHEVNYSYHVPDEFVVILQEIHRLRENVAGYGDTFADWLTRHLTNRATETVNLSGTDGFLAIREKQAFVQGFFDFGDGLPEKPTRDEEPNLWVTSMTYKFRYDKPIEAVMNYPIAVHQQMLSRKFRPKVEPYTYQSVLKQFSYSAEKLAKFAADNQKLQYLGNRGLMIPPFDLTQVTSYPSSTVRAFLALTSISATDPTTLLNLNELGDFNLNQDVLDFMVGEAPFMTTQYQSILQLDIYADRRIQLQSLIQCSDDLVVSFLAPADLRTTWRVRLGMVLNLNYLPQAALDRLSANPVAACKICNAINAAIRDLSNMADVMWSQMRLQELRLIGLAYDDCGNVVSEYSTGLKPDPNRIMRGLVENLFIVAARN